MVKLRRLARRLQAAVLRGYEPAWRYVFNLRATVRYARRPPELSPVARQLEERLRRDGIATTTLGELTGDPTLLPRLQAAAAEAERRRGEAPSTTHLGAQAARPFLIHMFDPVRPEVDPAGVFAEVVLNKQLKGLIDTYFRMTTRVSDLNVWRNLPRPTPTGASTQLWHRDLAEDRCIVKVFIYLEDVDEGGGPFMYSRGSHLAGPRGDTSGMEHDGINYRVVSPDRLERIERDAVVCTGTAGTTVIADVRGFHRGGLAVTSSRFMLQARYASLTVHRFHMLAPPPGVNGREHRRELLYDMSRRSRRPVTDGADGAELPVPAEYGKAPA